MIPFKQFIRHNLAPADRLGEILFGLIMALGFTGAVRIGVEDADNRLLLTSILGCNIAWGIVDGVMYVLVEVFERGRRHRVARDVATLPGEAEAVARVEEEYGDLLGPVLSDAERAEVYRKIVGNVRGAQVPKARVRREDLLGGAAVALVILLATAPVVVPYLLFREPAIAVRVSEGIALGLLFVLGCWWGRMTGGSSWRFGAGLTLIGVALVAVTLALGG